MTLNPQFLTDKKGKKIAVQLSVKEFEFLIEELEMKEDIAVYEKVKAICLILNTSKKERKNNTGLGSTSF